MNTVSTVFFLVLLAGIVGLFVRQGIEGYRGLKASDDTDLLDQFYFLGGNLTSGEFTGTLSASMTGLANIVFVFSIWGYQYGLGVALWVWLFWVFGLSFFFFLLRRKNDFFARQATLHEFLGEHFGSLTLRRLAALVSVASFIIVLALEIIIGASVLQVFFGTGTGTRLIFIVVITIALGIYTGLGGFETVIRTDRLQLSLMAIGFAGIVYLLIVGTSTGNFGSIEVTGLLEETLMAPFKYPIFVFANIVGWMFWFPVTMDQWQRCSATGNLDTSWNATIVSFAWFLVVTVLALLMGVAVSGMSGAANEPALAFLESVSATGGMLVDLVVVTVAVSFVAAVISTVDTFLLATALSAHNDIRLPMNNQRISTADDQQKELSLARRWMLFGMLGSLGIFISLHAAGVPLDALFYLGWVAQMALFPVVTLAAYERWIDGNAAVGSVVGGVLVAVGSALYAAFQLTVAQQYPAAQQQKIIGEAYNLLYLSPVITVTVATITYFLFYITQQTRLYTIIREEW